jgi:hypothetical protein
MLWGFLDTALPIEGLAIHLGSGKPTHVHDFTQGVLAIHAHVSGRSHRGAQCHRNCMVVHAYIWVPKTPSMRVRTGSFCKRSIIIAMSRLLHERFTNLAAPMFPTTHAIASQPQLHNLETMATPAARASTTTASIYPSLLQQVQHVISLTCCAVAQR